LLNDSGTAIIKSGWLVIKKSDDSFRCHVYDGNIDFYKLIENKTLTDIGLTELNHLKNLDTVVETWTNLDLPYRYNLADYNGKTGTLSGRFNIDYMIPSASVAYLFNRIFQYFGWTYEGSAFETEEFKNTWQTYPKPISDEDQVTTLITSINWDNNISYGEVLNPQEINSLTACTGCVRIDDDYAIGSSEVFNILGTNVDVYNRSIGIKQEGLYKFTISGAITNSFGNGTTIEIWQGSGSNLEVIEVGEITYGETFQIVFYQTFDAGDEFTLQIGQLGFNGASGNVNIDFEVVEGNTVDFEEAFIGMSITDFIREVLVRFALTPFTDPINKHVRFLNLSEIINVENAVDWSDKFHGKISEQYIVGNYGQRNRFSFKYNDDDVSYNDGLFLIDNINLKDEVDVFKSNIYSPERNKVVILGQRYNVYKMWEKEVKDDGSINYKDLDNRFYWMKSEVVETGITVESELFDETRQSVRYARENFSSMNFTGILQLHYQNLSAIVNKSKIFELMIRLNQIDIEQVDLSKIVYIEQLSSYFLIDKIKNWEKGKLTAVDAIKLNIRAAQDDLINLEKQIIIDANLLEPNTPITFVHSIYTTYSFVNYLPDSATIYMKQLDGSPSDNGQPTGFEYNGLLDLQENNFNQNLPFLAPFNYGWYEVQVVDNEGRQSNKDYVFWGDSTTGNPGSSIELIPEILGIENNTFFEHTRDFQYRFNNFTPQSATLSIQVYNFNVGPIGPKTVVNLTDLAADTLHTVQDVTVPGGGLGWWQFTIETDTITYQIQRALL
jgi:hypothetical protein